MRTKCAFLVILLMLGGIACQNDEFHSVPEQELNSPMDAFMGDNLTKSNEQNSDLQTITSDFLGNINDELASNGMNFRVLMAETQVAAGSGEVGITVIAKHVGNKHMDADFVPNDARREWSGPDFNEITYAIDATGDAVPFAGGLSASETDAAIERATDTWRNTSCSDIGLVRNDDFGIDIGVVAFQFGLGGSPFVFADIQHAGWRDIDFADGVLGVTFTFIWIDGLGEPTDFNSDGKADVAFREIYYDPSWIWADDGATNIDVESVAVHELGHGLSQAHFGNVFLKKNGELKASPRAVMNALYASPYRELTGTDNAGHCSIWASWPQN